MVPEMRNKPLWESLWRYLDPWDSVGKYGPHGELFFFVLKKEPLVLSELVEFGPSVSAETIGLEKCGNTAVQKVWFGALMALKE